MATERGFCSRPQRPTDIELMPSIMARNRHRLAYIGGVSSHNVDVAGEWWQGRASQYGQH